MNRCYGRLFLSPLLILAGCQTTRNDGTTDANPYQLAGTTWLLIQQGPASEAGRLADVPPYAYTMALSKDGSARFKFDCNLGTGRWKSSPAGPDGKLSFGTIAVSTKLCPAGSIGEQLSGAMHGQIAFSIYDGRLTIQTHDPDRLYVWDSVD
ncbi:META domain-containing protein [Novosphingobium sp.]|uniref:META domain-containing protein n=1 Tax=Novosphingobium sp. TaxID=1874826 RepID=UPI0025E76CE9|nr:META domain-containing protein [Novosphingobium sp.]